jgi:hypothetical protein
MLTSLHAHYSHILLPAHHHYGAASWLTMCVCVESARALSRLFASFALSPHFKLPEKMSGQILRRGISFISRASLVWTIAAASGVNGECVYIRMYDLLLWWLQRKDLLCVKWSGKYFTPIHFPRALPMESVPREYYDTLFIEKSLGRQTIEQVTNAVVSGHWSVASKISHRTREGN